jgi:hypothetical protein
LDTVSEWRETPYFPEERDISRYHDRIGNLKNTVDAYKREVQQYLIPARGRKSKRGLKGKGGSNQIETARALTDKYKEIREEFAKLEGQLQERENIVRAAIREEVAAIKAHRHSYVHLRGFEIGVIEDQFLFLDTYIDSLTELLSQERDYLSYDKFCSLKDLAAQTLEELAILGERLDTFAGVLNSIEKAESAGCLAQVMFGGEELLEEYPGLDPKEREHRIAEKHGAVFIIGIGADLADGKPHDGRAPDYDDWSSETESGYRGLNGDIVIWNPVLETAFELSSMGIRVDRLALLRQLEIQDKLERKELLFHKRLIAGEFPESVGGGIGQSRLCMYFLRKAHIGEVQASLWPGQMHDHCRRSGIFLM